MAAQIKTLTAAKPYKRILAIGDIHGEAGLFQSLMETVQPGEGDLVVTLGDYIDRGVGSRSVIDALHKLHMGAAQKGFDIISLRGNHDAMLLMCWDGLKRVGEYYDSQNGSPATDRDIQRFREEGEPAKIWFRNGAEATLNSYCSGDSELEQLLKGLAELINDAAWKNVALDQDDQKMLQGLMTMSIPEEHVEFLRQTCVDALETDNFIFAHGGLYPRLTTLAEQPLIALHWYAPNETPHFMKEKKLVVGHMIKSFQPQYEGHYLNIDTGAYAKDEGGQLTCIDVQTGEYWQSGDDNGAIAMSTGKLELQ